MPHVIGPVGGPPPPTPHEVRLLAEIARLSTQLDAAHQAIAMAWLVPGHTPEHRYACSVCKLKRALRAYNDVVAKETTDASN